MIRDRINWLIRRDALREWWARRGVTLARLSRGDIWWTPAIYSHTGHRYLKLQLSWLRWTLQLERRS